MGMKIDAALVTSVYVKSMKLSMESRAVYKTSEITNLMAVDAGRLEDICEYLNNIWSAPFQILMAVYFLYKTIGASVFGGVVVMVLMIPGNALLATRAQELGKEQMTRRDERSGLMDEILTGIKVVKLNAWEESFKKKVKIVRDQELDTLKRIAYLSSMTSLTWSITPFLVSLVSFALYSWTNQQTLTSGQIFVSVSLFNLLSFPLMVFPNLIAALVEASVSIRRLEKYLRAEERIDYIDREFTISTKSAPIERVVMRDGTFGFQKERSTLFDVSFKVHDGELLAVVGKVGSGKSAIMSALLGEIYKTQGTVLIRGAVAYVPQSPFIMNATVRENILFGLGFDKRRYESIVEGCGLAQDIINLPGGDNTEIGEKRN
jgi:ABC-type multidrug transport system fused ATPase/permease subunit